MSDVVRVAMWSGPRNISTAMMRAFENRPDTVVVDEPLYAFYLARTNANHPGRVKDYIVALQPFTVLAESQTKYPYFQNESHGGISAEWSDDGSVALVTLDGKWGPHDVFLLEFRDGKLGRTTNILAKAHDLLLPSYRKSKAEPYNDNFDFIFDGEDGPVFKLEGTNHVVIDATQ